MSRNGKEGFTLIELLAVIATPTEMDLFEEPGIVDVFSGSDALALDGSSYSEW